MPFCTSCRAPMEATAQVCPSCGRSAGGGAPAKAAAPAPPQKSGSALKVILLVLGGLVLLFVVVIAVGVGGAYYVAKQTHVETTSGGAKVETPFGTVETTTDDSAKIAEKMGVEVYPGAKALPGGASVKLGGMSTASVLFESDDPPEKVADFYRKQFPNANVTSHSDDGGTHIALMIGKNEKWTTITIEGHEGGSKIVIASVNGGAK
jgi:hypothetical protein